MTRAVTVALAALIIGTMGMSGAVAAQQAGGTPDNTTNPTPTATTNGGNGTQSTVENGSVRLDDYTAVTGWSYSRETGRWTVTFDSEEPGTVTLAESGQFSEGANRFNILQERIPRGTHTITVDAPPRNNQSQLSITSSRSIDEGRGVVLSTGQTKSDDGSANPFATPGPMGWFGGAAVTLSMGLWAFRKRLRGGSGGPKEAWD